MIGWLLDHPWVAPLTVALWILTALGIALVAEHEFPDMEEYL